MTGYLQSKHYDICVFFYLIICIQCCKYIFCKAIYFTCISVIVGAEQKLASPEQLQPFHEVVAREVTHKIGASCSSVKWGAERDISHMELHSSSFVKIKSLRPPGFSAINTIPKETQSYNLPIGGRHVQKHTYLQEIQSRRRRRQRRRIRRCFSLTLPANAEAVHSEIPVEFFLPKKGSSIHLQGNGIFKHFCATTNIRYKPRKGFCKVLCICSF